jgi:hypothetical protein
MLWKVRIVIESPVAQVISRGGTYGNAGSIQGQIRFGTVETADSVGRTSIDA